MSPLTIPARKQLKVYTAEGFFDRAYAALKRKGVDIISAQELAYARRLTGKESDELSNSDVLCAEGHIYQPQNPNIILITDRAHNPILKNYRQATDAQRRGKEFYVDASKLLDLVEEDAKKAIKSGVLALPRKAVSKAVSVEKLADNPYFAFTLREEAKPYGQFLAREGLDSVFVALTKEDKTKDPEHEGNPFARLLTIRSNFNMSIFHDDTWSLDDKNSICGVRMSAGLESILEEMKQFATPADLEKVRRVLSKYQK